LKLNCKYLVNETKRQSAKNIGNYEMSPTSSQYCMNFDPQTA